MYKTDLIDHDAWLIRGYDSEPTVEEYREFCLDEAKRNCAEDAVEDDWEDYIAQHKEELRKEFWG